MGLLGAQGDGIYQGQARHWHKQDMRIEPERWYHAIKDPRTIEGLGRDDWTDDQSAFVRHLEDHEAEQKKVDRSPGDSPAVAAIFDQIDRDQAVLDKRKMLVLAIRREERCQRRS